MKSVLLSIQPKWCELIASGKKTIEVRKTAPKLQTPEVRKTAPKLQTPFKCYIYQTKTLTDNKAYSYKTWARNGKVIGEFVCDRIEKFNVGSLRSDDIEKLACLTYNEIINYFYKPEELDGKTVKVGYGWHISDLKIYDKPKELGELFKPCKVSCYNCKNPKYFNGTCEEKGKHIIERAPQSWCYVEEL